MPGGALATYLPCYGCCSKPVPPEHKPRWRQVLVTHRPEATTALLMQLCTPGERDSDWFTQVADFAHIYSERCCVLCRWRHQHGCLETQSCFG